ncbi:MAG: hypothetical protein U9R17_01105 [Thermodesulfobacteriota bacterium]|nr:hypothetical protein [Thermodesulfobacteriota bacterium]
MPQVDIQEIKDKIHPIQDIAIILTGAGEFVCEKRMLKRFSAELESNLVKLEKSIAAAKKNFAGKLNKIQNLDSHFSEIRDINRELKSNDTDLVDKCLSKNIGGKLTDIVSELKNIINNMEKSLQGENNKYTITDRVIQNSIIVKSFVSTLAPLIYKTLKIILATAIFAIGLFVFLFFTMESKNDLIEGIKIDRVYLKGKLTELEGQRNEWKKITDKIESVKKKLSTRQDKIKVIDLTVKKRKIQESMEKTLLSIKTKESKLSEKRKKLKEINEKSFFQRLFRRWIY